MFRKIVFSFLLLGVVLTQGQPTNPDNGLTAEEFTNLVSIIDTIKEIIEKIKNALEWLGGQISEIIEEMTKNLKDFIELAKKAIIWIGGKIREIIQTIIPKIKEFIEQIVQKIKEIIESTSITEIIEKVKKLIAHLKKMFECGRQVMPELVKVIFEYQNDTLVCTNQMVEDLQGVRTEYVQLWFNAANTTFNFVKNIVGCLQNSDPLQCVSNAAQEWMKKMSEIKQAMRKIMLVVTEQQEKLVLCFQSAVDQLLTKLEGVYQKAVKCANEETKPKFLGYI